MAEFQVDMFAMPVEAPKPVPMVPVASVESRALNAVYGEYLEHSIRYYALDAPVVSDGYFDNICQTLQAGWGLVTHRYKHMCDESALRAGTGFQLPLHKLDTIVWLCRQHRETPLKDIYGIHP
jgi:hypothetical protein